MFGGVFEVDAAPVAKRFGDFFPFPPSLGDAAGFPGPPPSTFCRYFVPVGDMVECVHCRYFFRVGGTVACRPCRYFVPVGGMVGGTPTSFVAMFGNVAVVVRVYGGATIRVFALVAGAKKRRLFHGCLGLGVWRPPIVQAGGKLGRCLSGRAPRLFALSGADWAVYHCSSVAATG